MNLYIVYPYYIMLYVNYTSIKELNNTTEDRLVVARGGE